ncbi:MAG: tripartite tricarboxylate transporter substrate binding protein [Polaromonas sp.]|nr:tripartite tricarboxylate transporter substrate binding protein [Polaromonas sp.]
MTTTPTPGVTRRRLLTTSAALVLPASIAFPARAATWPDKPLRLVVGYPPGSSPDALARTIADPLAKVLGQAVIVDNKAGAAGVIGVDAVARATDGHTIGLTGNGPLTTAKALNPKVPFDVLHDLRPISLVANSPFVLVGKPSAPARDLASFIAYAKAQGDRLSYGSVGLGSGSHLAMEYLKMLTGIKPVHIPFPGFPQVATAMFGDQIDMAFVVPSVAAPQQKAGRLRIYAVSSAARSASFPDLPPVAQVIGKPEFDVSSWNGVFGPAKMPPEHVARLSREIAAIVKSEEVRQRLFLQGWETAGTNPEAMTRTIEADTAMWGKIIRATGTTSE